MNKSSHESHTPEKELTLGQQIARARRAAGLTQDGLEEATGLPKNSISEWERDVREPRVGALLKIADAVGLTLDELVRGGPPVHRSAQLELGLLVEQVEAVRTLIHEASAALRRAAQHAAAEGGGFDDILDALASIRSAEREIGELSDD